MLNKKAQGMHMWGGTDAIIILVGVIIGLAIAWYGISSGWPVVSGFCPGSAVP